MSQPDQIYYCHACGRVAESAAELLRKGCEGTHQRYLRDDIVARLVRAIRDHQRATLAKVNKAAWSVANAELYRAALDVEDLLVS